MAKWFVVHDLLAYSQHPNLISNVSINIRGLILPKSKVFRKINVGDQIVYYATKDMVVVGIFQIVSNVEIQKNDEYWGTVAVHKIEPVKLPPKGRYLDFKKLVTDSSTSFERFPNKKNWGNQLQGKTCFLLSENDFLRIETAFSQKDFLKPINYTNPTPTRWHEKYGKDYLKQYNGISDYEKILLHLLMNCEQNNMSGILTKDIKRISDFKNVNLNECLIELRKKRFVKIKKWGKQRESISFTRRGRAFARFIYEKYCDFGRDLYSKLTNVTYEQKEMLENK